MGFLRRERVLDGHGVRSVSGAKGKRPDLEQSSPARHQLLADAPQRQVRRGVRYGAGAIWPQLVRERVVATQTGDFVDQIDYARHVGSPAGNLDDQPVVLRRRHETDGRQQALDLFARHGNAEQMVYARLAQEHRPGLLRLRPKIDRRLAHLAARQGTDQVDRARQCIGHAEHVDAPLEAIARFTRNAEGATGAANARRLEIGGFEDDVRGILRDLGFGTPHDAGNDLWPFGVANGRHLRRELARDSVQRDDRFARFGASDDDRRPTQLGEIEGVQRLVELEQDVIRRVDDVVDRALADALKPRGQPGRTWLHFDATNDRGHVARRALWILEADFHTIHVGTSGTSGTSDTTGVVPTCSRADGYLGQLHRRSQAHRQLARDSLVA